MLPAVLVVIYCILILLASLFGGWLPSVVRLTHTRMQVVLSLVSGLMLGVAMLHLFPHAVEFLPSLSWAITWLMIGLLGMFFLIRIFDFHQHGAAEESPDDDHHDHAHDHDVPGHHAHEHSQSAHRFSWIGLALGLAVHTAIDGIALGASVVAESHNDGATWTLFGLGTFLAIALHKPLDALSITSLMTSGGWSRRQMLIVNGGFALMCPLGAALFWFSSAHWFDQQDLVIGCALAFSAGVFLCISLGDLLPEVHFHHHDRVKLSVALLLGVAIAYGIEQLPGHSHEHESHSEPGEHKHDHGKHDHGIE